MSFDLSNYLEIFADEAREHLQALNQALLAFEKSPGDLDLVNVMFRSAHTLKGMSATMGFNEVAELTHRMENCLTPIRQGEVKADSAAVDLLFRCLDALQEMVEAHIGGQDHAVDISDLVEELTARSAAASDAAKAPAASAAGAPPAKTKKAQPVAAQAAAASYSGQLGEVDLRAAQAALDGGARLLLIRAALQKDCELRNVRAFMLLRALKALGGVIHATPDEKALTETDFGYGFDLLLATKEEVAVVESSGGSVLEVESVKATLISDLAMLGEAAPEAVSAPAAQPQSQPAAESAGVRDASAVFNFNEYDIEVINAALDEGYRVIHAHVQLTEDCTLKSARAFMVNKRLEELGDIIATQPAVEDIEFERFERDLDFLVLTKSAEGAAAEALKAVSELSLIEIVEQPVIPKRASRADEMVLQAAVPADIQGAQAQRLAPPAELAAPAEPGAQSTAQALATAAPPPAAPRALKTGNGPPKPVERVRQSQTIRVDTERLDALLNLVGELVIGKTRLSQLTRDIRNADLSDTIEQIGHIVFDLQNVVMQTRMIPIETVFNRFPRMIRDLAKSRGKQVELVMSGGETELDRTVIDEIGDPLVHLIRNAVDHGVEEPAVREAAGKNPTGTLSLAAFHQGSNVFIEIRDDGKGIDPEVIRRKAVEKGLITQDYAATLTREQAVELILLPGLSTNEQVTDISGRGVGMDVVRSKIEDLSGEVRITTEMGVGSTFTIKLPLTLAIVQALLVKIAGEEFAVPFAYIEETLRIWPKQIQKVNQQDVTLLRGEILPLISMRTLLHSPDAPRRDESWYVVVVRAGGERVGLCVDSTVGQTEIVIKTLGRYLSNTKYIAGGTILGDGTVALILDVARIAG